MAEIFLKFPLFYLANEEIQSGKIQNNIYIFNFPLHFLLDFLVRKMKEQEFEKNSVILYHIFIHTYPGQEYVYIILL